jgi:hypothetical protein
MQSTAKSGSDGNATFSDDVVDIVLRGVLTGFGLVFF